MEFKFRSQYCLVIVSLCALISPWIFAAEPIQLSTPVAFMNGYLSVGVILALAAVVLGLTFWSLLYRNRRLVQKIMVQQQTLQERDKQMRVLTSNMSDWIWTLDAKNNFTYLSPSVQKLLGYNATELMGENIQLILHPSDAERAYVQYTHVLTASKRGECDEYRDLVWRAGLLHKNGHVLWTETALRAFFMPDGDFAGAQGCTRDISERKQAEEAIRQLAFNDPLTQLPNRRLLNDRIRQAMASCKRHHQYCAVLFLDVDNFKYINDNYGHDNGDILLQQIALRLASGVRASDTVARFGGDEFVIVSEQLSTLINIAKEQALMIGSKTIELFEKEFVVNDLHCNITASIGIALFNDDTKTIPALLKYADIAMYEAKAHGRSRCEISEASIAGTLGEQTNA